MDQQVTVSRELLRQVLIALEGAQDNLREHGDNCFLHDEGQYNSCFCGRDSIENHLQETVEALSALFDAPEAEPVLWMHQQGNHDEVSERPLLDDEKARGWTEVPLFTASQSQPAPVQEQQFTADELDLMRQWFESMQDTNRSFVIDADKKLHQKIIAAIQAAPRAEQPRKAVKLSDSEILTALDVEYVSSAQNRELFLSDARTIEQAVWAKLGVTE